ncbi:hypothetical protein DR864_29100 (plasmid) [Runella rosea]|uniref:DUF2490 domain-containing protein n=1 Tax=Runella rosea TaxID=2259595 RepID=A0A344TTF4_9BACT|nr:hypothetical protein [Runella rosea]AXE21925.1 hypothetical protein DR864_29100 [Runella rosea]
MKHLSTIILLLLLFVLILQRGFGQSVDSTQTVSSFSGSVGLTNNGFSIVPTFSLNSPAAIMNFYWRKKRFSFDPDIRLVPDASKGGLIFWFRYRLIEQKKFSLRVGGHPAFTLIRRNVTDNGKTTEITELLRFLAFEVVPNYQITTNWNVSATYLQGNALQKNGPQLTRVLFLATSISNIKLSEYSRFQFIPMVFFLHTDGYRGDYFSATGILSHKKLPFSLHSTINQTFQSNVPNNQDFMWNIMVAYNFSRNFKNVQ